MTLRLTARQRVRLFCVAWMLAPFLALAQTPPHTAAANRAAPPPTADANTIVSTTPMHLEVDDSGGHGQLVVASEVLTPDTQTDLVYTITQEPRFGRVGLAGGGDDSDIFQNKTSRFGYFAYRAQDGYVGEDSFAYSVRNETSGLVFKNTVVVTVKAPPPVVLPKYRVDATRERGIQARPVSLTTRPNTPITQKLPSHEDFMGPADRIGISNPKIAYVLDDKAKPQNGTARLDRTTGQLTYAPNPGFIGEDKFKYYTVDENNPHLGVENIVSVDVSPIRHVKHVTVDRSHSRQVDLVFVINNSPSMAPHQARIAANLSRFRQLFNAHDLDYRIGVLTTDFVDADPDLPRNEQEFYKEVRSVQLDKQGNVVVDDRGRPKQIKKRVASNGALVTLPVMDQPWITRDTPDSIFAELVKVGTNGDSNRTAFTAVYNFVADYYNKEHAFLRPDATTFVVYFMDEEETRMAVWKDQRSGPPKAEWIENGKLPDLIEEYNARNPKKRQTLDSYINYWVLRPFIIAKGNKRGSVEMEAVVAPNNISHRRAAELTGGSVLNIESDFSSQLAALGDRIAETVAVALPPVDPGATFYEKSVRVLVDGQPVPADPQNGWVYDHRTHSIRLQGEEKKKAFTAKIDVTYEEHM